MSFENQRPTVLLVHGAFADASSWAGVIAELQAVDIPVFAVANGLRSLSGDAEYVASAANQIEGPVVLVGHSYGGSVITVAGAHAKNVVALVYVAAYIPDEGERAADHAAGFPETAFTAAARPTSYPIPEHPEPAVELHLDPAPFGAAFAADLPPAQTAVLAVAQRPLALAAVEEPASAAAWKSLPSRAIVATSDRMIHPDSQRAMADRAGAQVVEIDASHAIALSQPVAVAAQIRAMVDALAATPATA